MMNKEEMKRLNLTPVEDFIDEDFGKVGTPQRVVFDSACDAFALGEIIKAMRNEAGLTQEELAEKIGTKKSYISRIENGNSAIQLNTLFRICNGLGKQMSLSFS